MQSRRAGTVCLCVWICITQPTPGRSQSAALKVHKSWMFWPVITRPPAFQPCRVPDSDRQPSSLGLKQTLWNVLMGRELILGLNLSGSLVPPQVYIPAPHSPSLISWKQIVRTLKDVRHLGHYWYVWKFEFQTSAITLMALSLGTTIRDDFIQIPLFPDETLMLAMSAVKKKKGGWNMFFYKTQAFAAFAMTFFSRCSC